MLRRFLTNVWLILIVGVADSVVQQNSANGADKTPPIERSIVRIDPALDQFLSADAKIEEIGEGFAWCEGPVWIRDGGFLLFSDIPNNAIIA